MSDSEKLPKNIVISVGERNLERAHNWTKAADQKAGFTLTVSLALLGISLSAIEPALNVIVKSVTLGRGAWILIFLLVLSFCVYFISALLGILILLKVVRPQTASTTKRISPLHFATISTMELEKFKTIMQEMSFEQLVDELSDQTYIVAQIATRKFALLDKAFSRLLIAVVSGLIFILASTMASIFVAP